jgi:hypothetical protein
VGFPMEFSKLLYRSYGAIYFSEAWGKKQWNIIYWNVEDLKNRGRK